MSSLADQIIETVESSVDDEFEVQTLHKSSTVFSRINLLASYLLMVILAWVLPSGYIWWAFSPILPILIAEFVSIRWLRKYTARPRAYKVHGTELAIIVVLLVILLASVAYRLYGSDGNESLSSIIGLIVGAVVGGIGVAILLPRMLRKSREEDFQRLDGAADEEE